jgi:hypothetical protein
MIELERPCRNTLPPTCQSGLKRMNQQRTAFDEISFVRLHPVASLALNSESRFDLIILLMSFQAKLSFSQVAVQLS